MHEGPLLSVVVPTYRRPARVRRLVAALERQTLDPARFEAVIVDNGSDDDTSAVLAELAASTPLDLRPLGIDVNRGPAPARNAGWRSSRGRFVTFTDDDCVPRPEWLERILDRALAEPRLGVLQGATHMPPGPYSFTTTTSFRETLAPSAYFEGCNLTFPRSVLERTGGFDETFHFGGEDTSAGWAATEHGEWVFEGAAIVEHDIEQRPLKWHLMMAWREGFLVDVAARYPEFRRRGFWKPWAHRPWNVAFMVGAVSTLVALRRPVALLGWIPWLRYRCPFSPRHPKYMARTVAFNFLNDAVVEAGMLRASIRNRTLVL